MDSSELYFKKMEVYDCHRMVEWGSNSDPLLVDYDYWPRTREEVIYWHREKTKSTRNEYFSFYLDDRPIAYLSIKDIDLKKGVSYLGIVMDPNFQSRGYGTRIMKMFLEYYFNERKFNSLRLKVDLFNKRAIALYRALGFRKLRNNYSLFGTAMRVPVEKREYFIIIADIAISKGMIMEVSACDL